MPHMDYASTWHLPRPHMVPTWQPDTLKWRSMSSFLSMFPWPYSCGTTTSSNRGPLAHPTWLNTKFLRQDKSLSTSNYEKISCLGSHGPLYMVEYKSFEVRKSLSTSNDGKISCLDLCLSPCLLTM